MGARSLQDVFSDSGRATGSSQKTSRLFKYEQGKGAQLEGESGQKPRSKGKGGRKKLQQCAKKSVKLQVHVTQGEYQSLEAQFRASGERYMSDFLRKLILDTEKSGLVADRRELVKQLDGIGAQISKVGNNINQVAKYANIQNKSGKVDPNTLDRFDKLMQDYLREQKKLINAYRALVRNN